MAPKGLSSLVKSRPESVNGSSPSVLFSGGLPDQVTPTRGGRGGLRLPRLCGVETNQAGSRESTIRVVYAIWLHTYQ
jgi:hypothetical protein